MTDQQPGRLYSSSGAHQDGAIPALSSRRRPRRGLPPLLAGRGEMSAGLVFLLVVLGTVSAGALDRLITGGLGLLTSIAFVAFSLAAASRARSDAGWAVWTAPPIGFAVTALVISWFGKSNSESALIAEGLGLLLGLSEHMWPVLLTTLACWVISRRRTIADRRARRQAERGQL